MRWAWELEKYLLVVGDVTLTVYDTYANNQVPLVGTNNGRAYVLGTTGIQTYYLQRSCLLQPYLWH